MNRLVLDKEIFEIEDIDKIIVTDKSNLKIICKGNNKIVLEKRNDFNLEIELLDNSKLDLYTCNYDFMGDNKILIKQHNNTVINYNESLKSYNESKMNINNVIMGDNNESNIKVRCISYNKRIDIIVNLDVMENTKNNNLVEDIKGICAGGIVEIKPDMEINTNEVSANHFVTISNVGDSEIFYLETKGMDKITAKNLILDGFIKSILMDMEVKK